MTGFLSLLTMVSTLVAGSGGIVAGIWLIILGKWVPVVSAILISLVATFFIGFAMLPSGLLAYPAMKALEKGNRITGYFLMLCSQLYINGILWFWTMFIFSRAIKYVSYNGTGLTPLLILAYCVVTAPIISMATKEINNNATSLTAMFFTIGCFLFTASLIFGIRPSTANYLLMGTMAIGMFIMFVESIEITTAELLKKEHNNY